MTGQPFRKRYEQPPRRRAGKRDSQVATVLHLYEKGLSQQDIIEETGLSAVAIRRAVDLTGDDELRRRSRDCATGSAALREAIFAQSAEREQRRRAARSIGHGAPLQHAGPHPVLHLASGARPPAAGRDPCPRCGTRGDLGCRHRAPCEAGRP